MTNKLRYLTFIYNNHDFFYKVGKYLGGFRDYSVVSYPSEGPKTSFLTIRINYQEFYIELLYDNVLNEKSYHIEKQGSSKSENLGDTGNYISSNNDLDELFSSMASVDISKLNTNVIETCILVQNTLAKNGFFNKGENRWKTDLSQAT